MNAPEKIYRSETWNPLQSIYYGEDKRVGCNITYIRADIHEAQIDTLKAENAELHAECDRLTNLLQWEQNRRDHIGTHGDDCWKWGPAHHECAMREIERLTAMLGPQKPMSAEEVTQPGFYWWKFAYHRWVIVIARYDDSRIVIKTILGDEIFIGKFIGPIKMPEVQG